jgi:hypothetical protein
MTTIEKLNKDIFIQRYFFYVLLPENKNLKEYEILSLYNEYVKKWEQGYKGKNGIERAFRYFYILKMY